MTTSYKLIAFSRNVGSVSLGINKHSGYGLVKYEDGQPVAIKTVEVTASSSFGEMNFASSEDLSSGYIDGWIPLNEELSVDGKIIPEKVFEDGQWKETTQEWVEDREYGVVELETKDGYYFNNAEEVYRQIQNNADILNHSCISYDPANMNCNTWTGYIADTILEGIDVSGQLNAGLEKTDVYIGCGLPFPFPGSEIYFPTGVVPGVAGYLRDKAMIDNAEKLQAYLQATGQSYRDIQISISCSAGGVSCRWSTADGEQKIFTPLKAANKEPVKDILKQRVATAEKQASPLVIDLDGDGIVETNKENSSVYFDHDNNGLAESTGWVNSDDGLLVRDINGNGQIDNGSELFGNNTILSNGQKAANGFEALKDLDSNNDGVFNSSDTAWNEVKVWKDSNSNGIVDEGELLTLEQANIAGVNLSYDSVNFSDNNNNGHKQQGTFIKSDGTSGVVHDVWFDANYANTLDTTNVEISDEIKALPEVLGFGNVHSLQTAMALDTTGELKSLVEQYIAETNHENRDAILTNLIYHWAGVQNEDPNGFYDNEEWFQSEVDCRKFCVLEEFLGAKYNNQYWGREVHPQAAQNLLSAFDELKNYIKNEIDKQSHVSSLLEKIELIWSSEEQKWQINIDGAITELKNIYTQNASLYQYTINSLANIISQQGILPDEIYNAFRNRAEEEVNHGIYLGLVNFGRIESFITEGNDIINGTSNNNVINGLGGDDRIFGLGGNDTLIGGAGNDYLVGGEGSDTYFFEGSWGHDSIENTSNDAKGEHPDTILFGEGIVPADVTVARNLNDLVLSLHDGADKITVYGYFVEGGTTTQTVDYVKFADGTTWTYDDVRTIWWNNPLTEGPLTTKEGTAANDYMNGTTGNDLLLGRDGNDSINGKGGSDVFVGGKGDDELTGGANNDTYVWNLGDGLDTIYDGGGNDIISFGKGISFSDLTFRCVDSDLKIMVNGDENQGVLIKQFIYSRYGDYRIEDIRFYDGSVFHLSDVGLTLQQSNEDEIVSGTGFDDIIYGNGGNDTINGGNGDDIIIGGKGIDILTTSTGDDVYVWNRGDGLDLCDYSVLTHGGQDTIRFGAGISFSDLTFKVLSGRNGDEMNIIVDGDETQGIRYRASNNDIAKLEFADGTIFNLTANGLTYQQTNDNETIFGTNFADVIYANGGDDIIYAQGGDTIYGGKGSDTYYLQNGENTIVYNRGDGLDTITSYGYAGGNSKVLFGEGISMSDLTFFMSPDNYGYDLHIILNGDKSQGIIIKSFHSLRQYIDVLEFADGTVFKFSENGLVFNQTERREEINGTDFADVFNAGNGDDRILTYNGNDIVNAGKGNDTIENGSGEKTFIYNLGDGMDKISMNYNSTGDCKIVFGDGITAADLSFVRMGSDLYVYVKDRSQGMLLDGHFYYGERVKTLEFSDGTTAALADFEYATETYNNGQIQGTAEDDVIVGNHLNNYITAGEGNNTVTGGKGNDDIRSGSGDDVFIYNLGDGADSITDVGGSDKIVFGEGISQNDITFRRDNDDNLLIVIKGDVSQSIKIDSFFRKDIYVVETLEFADGSSFNLGSSGLTLHQTDNSEDIYGGNTNFDNTVYAGDGHDNISVGNGNNTLIGGKGNDTITGGTGNDTYVYNLGDGFDTIYERGGNDKIVFGVGITQNDLSFEQIGSDLKISVNGDEVKGLQINNQFSSASNKVETVEFADGSTLDISNADQLIQAMSSFSLSNSASTDTLSDPTQDVSEMYSLAASELNTKAA